MRVLMTERAFRLDLDGIGDACALADGPSVLASNADFAKWQSEMTEYKTREDVARMLIDGPDSMQDVSSMRSRIGDARAARVGTGRARKRLRGQDTGDEICSSRFLDRDPTCWDRSVSVSVPRKIVHIGVENGVLGHRTRDELVPRGAAACVLADWLVGEGYNVAISALWVSRDFTTDGREKIVRLTLKRATEPLDLAAVTTACCELAFVRGILLFGPPKACPVVVKANLGKTRVADPEDKADFDACVPSDVFNETAAAAWLQSEIERWTACT